MRRIVRLVIVLAVLAGLAAPAALGAERMWVGFHDDPSFRWVANREARVQGASQTNATIIRLLVQWNLVARTRPANATDPFDPAYVFGDVDEAVRAAQENDQEVILTISGTPGWANGGKTPNVMPTRIADFTAFSRAIASRYSGRFSGTRSCASGQSGTSRTCSASSAHSSTHEGARSLPRTTRSWRQQPTPGSRPGTRRHRSRSARRQREVATRPRAFARRIRRGSSPSSSRRRTRGSSSTRGRTIRTPRTRTRALRSW